MNMDDAIGMLKEDAMRALTDAGIRWRIVKEEGNYYVCTCDYVPARANLTIENGIVTEVHGG